MIFTVRDTGIGIPEKDIPKLFKLFGVANFNNSNFNKQGSGLGLAISKKIIETIGGNIKLKSKQNIGTVVKFTVLNIHNLNLNSKPNSGIYILFNIL